MPARVDDRRVISGIRYVLRAGGRWPNCPNEDGPSTTIDKRFNHPCGPAGRVSSSWSGRGIWQKVGEALAVEARIGGPVAIDSTDVKAHPSAGPCGPRGSAPCGDRINSLLAINGAEKAPKDQTISISRGGPSTKIHLAVTVVGRPIGLLLGPGQRADIKAADALAGKSGPVDRLIADRAHEADRFRQPLREAHLRPLIPERSKRAKRLRHDKKRYRALADQGHDRQAQGLQPGRNPRRQARQNLPRHGRTCRTLHALVGIEPRR